LAEKLVFAATGAAKNPDEHSKADILTSGLNLAPAFPARNASGFDTSYRC
jgi:hypothetical protein